MQMTMTSHMEDLLYGRPLCGVPKYCLLLTAPQTNRRIREGIPAIPAQTLGPQGTRPLLHAFNHLRVPRFCVTLSSGTLHEGPGQMQQPEGRQNTNAGMRDQKDLSLPLHTEIHTAGRTL